MFEIKNAKHFDAFTHNCHLIVQEQILSRSFHSNKQSEELAISLHYLQIVLKWSDIQNFANHPCII